MTYQTLSLGKYWKLFPATLSDFTLTTIRQQLPDVCSSRFFIPSTSFCGRGRGRGHNHLTNDLQTYLPTMGSISPRCLLLPFLCRLLRSPRSDDSDERQFSSSAF